MTAASDEDLTRFFKNTVFALLIFFIGKYVAKIISGICSKLMTASKVDETLVKFLEILIYY